MSAPADVADLLRMGQLVRKTELHGRKPTDFRSSIESLWDKGMPPGSRTGWPSVDRHYSVVPGQLTVLTGWPGSGKSEWLDALLLNLAKQGWRFAIFSPENMPVELHVAKFVEKFIGKPFGPGPNERATKAESVKALMEIEEWFRFLQPAATTERVTFGIEEILDATEAAFRLDGVWKKADSPRGLVIDPWNEIEHSRPREWSETEYISQTLSRIRAWARAANIHVWIVAHPQKLPRDRDSGKLPIPRPDSISGSQHWWNKADNAITVWRPLDEPENQHVQIHVQKVRFKHVGRVGMVELKYDRVTGRYHEILQSVSDYRQAKDEGAWAK